MLRKPEFPIHPEAHNRSDTDCDVLSGMQLQDCFAAQDLSGLLSYPGGEGMGSHHSNNTIEGVASRSYMYADTTIEARDIAPGRIIMSPKGIDDPSVVDGENPFYRNVCILLSDYQDRWKELSRVLGVDGDDIENVFSRVHTLCSIEEDFNREMDEVSLAIGGTRYMDPPDGGTPTLGEQVSRMAEEIKAKDSLYEALHQLTNAAEYLINRVVETKGVRCVDDTEAAIKLARHALQRDYNNG